MLCSYLLLASAEMHLEVGEFDGVDVLDERRLFVAGDQFIPIPETGRRIDPEELARRAHSPVWHNGVVVERCHPDDTGKLCDTYACLRRFSCCQSLRLRNRAGADRLIAVQPIAVPISAVPNHAPQNSAAPSAVVLQNAAPNSAIPRTTSVSPTPPA